MNIMDCRFGFSIFWYLIPLVLMLVSTVTPNGYWWDRLSSVLAVVAIWLMWMALLQAGNNE